MAVSLLLQPQSIMGLYERFASLTPSPLLGFFPDRPVVGRETTIQYDTITYTRDVAKLNVRGGRPNTVKPPARGTVVSMAINVSEETYLPARVVNDLRAPGSTTPGSADAELSRHILQLRKRIMALKTRMAAQALGTAAGNLSFTLPGAAAAETVSLNYRATHQTFGSGWNTSTTDILAQINAAKRLITKDAGKQATAMIMNSTTGAYLTKNDGIMDVLSPAAMDAYRQAGRIERLCNLDIIYIDDVEVNDDTEVETGIIPDAFVAIIAGDNSDRGMLECAPQSKHAPPSYRGIFFHVKEEMDINGGWFVQNQYDFLPMLACPDDVVYDASVT